MRKSFIRTLVALAEQNERIVLLTGDLGFTVIEPFAERFPRRFFNVGVAEQNMIGLATGLAEGGYLPFAYSIATFATLRGYEIFRNGAVAQHLPVRVVGVGGGVEYGPAGITHHALEDIGVLRMQPGLTIVAPADHAQASRALLDTWELPGPVYYRLGKDDVTTVPGLDGRFQLGRTEVVREGRDLLLLSMGSVAGAVVAAADALAHVGVEATVAVVASVSPMPEDLVGLVEGFQVAITVENHYPTTGLGSLVSEVVAERGLRCRVVRRGIGHATDGRSGSEAYLHREAGLDPSALTACGLQAVRDTRTLAAHSVDVS